MEPQAYPILEFDPERRAIIEPHGRARKAVPPVAVLCFFHEVFEHLLAQHQPQVVHHLASEMGKHPVYQLEFAGQPFVYVHPGVGAPIAAGFLEEMIAIGCTRVVACGGAGVLDGTVALGHVIIPTAAVRDEGTSYHYLPPAREIAADAEAVATLQRVAEAHNVPHQLAKTWTTDAIYRETSARIARRRAEGCLTVEMECAAFFAVAQFRGIRFGQYLYGGDDVSGTEHDLRGWDKQTSVREQLFWLAAEAALAL
ncbi:MAG: nucleoside phosphorylase [Ktedonobacterales bacterium]|nr:nucleoside phosphorylase [Ktedonobacterales bacterium]